MQQGRLARQPGHPTNASKNETKHVKKTFGGGMSRYVQRRHFLLLWYAWTQRK